MRKSLYLALRWHLAGMLVALACGLVVTFEVDGIPMAFCAFALGVCGVLLLSLWANDGLLQLVRYCHERHHEAKRTKRAVAKQGRVSA